MIDVLRAQLLALRSQMDAMLAMMDSFVPQPPEDPAPCIHPETENIGTFGAPELKCTTCGKIITSSSVG